MRVNEPVKQRIRIITGRTASAKQTLSPPIAEDLGADDSSSAPISETETLLKSAYRSSENGDVSAAILASEAVLLIDSENIPALSLLASLYERLGDFAKAIRAAERIVVLNPTSFADRDRLDTLRHGRKLPGILGADTFETWSNIKVASKNAIAIPAVRFGLAAMSGLIVLLLLFSAVKAAINNRVVQSDQSLVSNQTIPAPGTTPIGTSAAPLTSVTIPNQDIETLIPTTAGSVRTSANPFAINQAHNIAISAPGQTPAPRVSYPQYYSNVRVNDRGTVPPLSIAESGNPDAPTTYSIRPLSPPQIETSSPVVGVVQTSAIPDHTVIVGGSSVGQTDQSGSDQTSSDDSGPMLPSHISIHVHHASAPASSMNDENSGSPQGPISDPSAIQARAMSLLHQGQYRTAAKLFGSAISKYKQNIANGEDVDESQRGLEACQVSLQICAQSQ